MPPSFVQSIESMSFGTLFTASKLTWTTGHWKTLIFHLRTHASEVLLWPSKIIKFGNLLAKDFWKLFSRGFFSRKNASCIIHRPRLSTSLTRIVGEQVQHLPEMVILIKFIDFTKLQNQQTTHLQPTSKPPWNPPFPSWIPTQPLPPLWVSLTAAPVPFSSKSTTESMKSVVQCSCHGRKKPTWETMGWWTLTSKLKKTNGWLGNWWWPSKIFVKWLASHPSFLQMVDLVCWFSSFTTWKKMRRLSNRNWFSFLPKLWGKKFQKKTLWKHYLVGDGETTASKTKNSLRSGKKHTSRTFHQTGWFKKGILWMAYKPL